MDDEDEDDGDLFGGAAALCDAKQALAEGEETG